MQTITLTTAAAETAATGGSRPTMAGSVTGQSRSTAGDIDIDSVSLALPR